MLRRRLGHFVVIGGGFSGVEVAGALADFLRSASRFYPRVKRDELRVTLLQDADRLLPELPASLGAARAAARCARAASTCAWARAPRGSMPTACGWPSGEFLDAAHGHLHHRHAAAIRWSKAWTCALQRGRIQVAADLSVPGAQGVWAIGDCAAVPNAR